MSTYGIVWIDHKEAHVFHVTPATGSETTVVSPAHIHRHSRGHADATRYPSDAKHYFDGVVKLLEGTDHVLVVGPSTAKLQFLRHVSDHDRAFASRIVGVETVDHPSDVQIVSYAREYFTRVDRMPTAERR
jgi:stalled ribosome rescue protein Dom34